MNITIKYYLFLIKQYLWKQLKKYNPFIRSNREKIKSFVCNNTVIFILLFVYILFCSFWEELINTYIIDKFLYRFESNKLVDFLFIAIAVLLFLRVFFRWGKNIKQITKLLCLIAISFWIYYRWFSVSFDFKSLYICEGIKYIDIVPWCSFWTLLPLLGIKKTHFDYKKDGFIVDTPITISNEDRLSIHGFAYDLMQRIWETDTSKSVFTCGIESPWGNGKTSFINLMKEVISEQPKYRKNTIIIDFNPWMYSAENELISVFLEELSKSLRKYDRTLGKNIIDYSKAISLFNTTETKIISSLVDFVQKDDSLYDKKRKIKDAISKIQKKVIVFIDDLDRLDGDELLEMMKLIRNVSDFPYMYFVAAYDKSYLVKCIEKKLNTNGTDFLRKVFLHEFTLPPISSQYQLIINHFSDLVEGDDRFNILALSLGYTSMEDAFYGDDGTDKQDYNIREIKRLSNSFKMAYERVKGYTNVCDLFMLEVLKMRYSTVFSLFAQRRDLFLVKENDYNRLYKENTNSAQSSNNVNKIDFIDYLKTHKDRFNITEIDIRRITTILVRLFDDQKRSRGINNVFFTNKYFDYREIIPEQISHEEFNELMKKPLNVIKSQIRFWSGNELPSLIERLTFYNCTSAEEILKQICVSIYFLSLNTPISLSIDLVGLIEKLERTITNDETEPIDQAVRSKYITEIVSELFKNKCNKTIAQELYYLRLRKKEVLFTVQDIDKLSLLMFNNSLVVDEISSILQFFYTLIRPIDKDSLDEKMKSEYDAALKSMREYIISNLDNVVSYLVLQPNYKKNRYFLVYDLILCLWNWDEFKSIVSTHSGERIKEFYKFIDTYGKFGFKKPRSIPFSFNYIKLYKWFPFNSYDLINDHTNRLLRYGL